MTPWAISSGAPPLVWEVSAVLWAAALAYSDISRRRLPNSLVLGAALVGLVHLAFTGTSPLGAGAVSMAAAFGVALLFTLPGYLPGKLGAGDVKLLCAIALLGGLPATLFTFVVGALLTLAAAWGCAVVGPRLGWQPATGRWLPFGAALAIGFVLAVISGTEDWPWMP